MTTRLGNLVRKTGYRVVRARGEYPLDFDEADINLVRTVKPYTMTTPERIVGLARAVEYVVKARIDGAVVECGVWRGGSMMAAAQILRELGDTERDLYLFDTFEGMTTPSEMDVSFDGQSAADALKRAGSDGAMHCRAGIDDVRANVLSTGYESSRVHLVRGMVEATIPDHAPDQISILRLDTDWYESTLHEMVCLFPRLAPGGVLIVDDYGHWQGARRAVDEYLASNGIELLLHRMDYSARIAIKPLLALR